MPVVDYNGLQGFDFKDLSQPLLPTQSSLACTSAGGSVTAQFPAVPYDYFWSIEQIAVSNTSSSSTVAKVYIDTPLTDINVIASTLSGNLDQDDINSPIILLPTKQLSVTWTNCSLGAVGTVRLQLRAKVLTPANSEGNR
jgi:hypothetical protein